MNASTTTAEKGPWLRYRDTGLHVLPYRHHALEFAALPFLHGIAQFDKVCLELPAWMPVDEVRGAVTTVAPGTGCLLIPAGNPVTMSVQEYKGDRHPVKRQVFPSSMLPITADAMMTVLRMSAADRRPRVEFVDADLPVETCADESAKTPFPYVDAQEAAERGHREWYARWKPFLQSFPPTPSDAYRESFMALRLMESVLTPDCAALFVCGAMHWHRIEALLDSRTPDDLRRELKRQEPPAAALRPEVRQGWLGERFHDPLLAAPSHRFTVCSLDPAVLHSLNMMDIPHVAQSFERQFLSGALRVDRDEWVRRMVAACWERTGRPVSPRALAVMEVFARRRLLSDARWSIDLDRHLLPAAAAAAGRSFAYELEQEAMQYELRPAGCPTEGRVVPLTERAMLIFVGSEIHLVSLPGRTVSPGGAGRPLRLQRSRTLTDKERDAIGYSGVRMKHPGEERLHQHMCNAARRLGHDGMPFQRRYRPLPFRGNLGRGPDARRTMRAQACGDETLYVRHSRHTPKRLTDCDACPVVWVFHRFAGVAERVTDFFADNSSGKTLLSSFYWFSERRYGGPVHVSRIAWFVRLYRNVTPSWDKALVERELIGRLPPDKFCTVRPWDDEDLPFDRDDPDLAVACAVKWSACDHITVVRVDPAYQVGDRARAFARDRGIGLLEPAVDALDRILVTRYEKDHELPTRGTWHPPDPIAARLVEPIPGFDEAPASIAHGEEEHR